MANSRAAYPSDLTEEQWAIITPLIPSAKVGGRPRRTDLREVIDAILYVDRTGCAWRAMPHDLPRWGTVYFYFRQFRNQGVWQRMHDTLREQVCLKEGRQATPSAAIVESQSVKTTEKGGPGVMMGARKSTVANGISS